MRTPTPFGRSMSPAAMIVAVLAIVLAAAGAGYSAGQIGTNDIKNNAITSPKIKNGQVSNADLVKEHKFVKIAAPGAPNFSNGGEGDCKWRDGNAVFQGIARASYQKDRFGMVRFAGLVISSDAPGGDATCDSSDVGEGEDGIVTILPSSLRPERTIIAASALTGGIIVVVGNTPLVDGSTVLPAGAIYAGNGGGFLDGISYYPNGTHLAARGASTKAMTPADRAMLHRLLH